MPENQDIRPQADETVNNTQQEQPEVEVKQAEADLQDAAEREALSEEDRLKQEVAQLRLELENEKKQYLFLMADFDNFRKRVLKEKAELLKNGSEKALKGLLPIVDDFERGLEATKDSDDAQAIRQGMELIYNKLEKYLGENQVQPMQTTGNDFDPDMHEAVAMIPATDDSQKGKVIDTTQKGYMLNDKVLRHAKVVVAQ